MTAVRRPAPTLAALAILVVANALGLGAAARNRSGEPEALVELTERELPLAGGARDDTSILLRLDWTAVNAAWPVSVEEPLFERAHLAALGFDVDLPGGRDAAARAVYRQLPRRAYLVLEQDGAAWTTWLAGYREWAARQEEPRHGDCCDPEQTERSHSRLFVVDAGLDAAALRLEYPDRRRFVIAPGVLRLFSLEQPEGSEPFPDIQIQSLLVQRVNVPRPLRPLLADLRRDGEQHGAQRPRFTARVAWGRSHQPWLVAVEPLPAVEPAAPAPEASSGDGPPAPPAAAWPAR